MSGSGSKQNLSVKGRKVSATENSPFFRDFVDFLFFSFFFRVGERDNERERERREREGVKET